MSERLVTELVEALCKMVGTCRCDGTGAYMVDCTLCGDSTHDHECDDRAVECKRPACAVARNALARATPEAVRQADAAPELYEALKALDEAAGSHNISTHDGWNVTAPRLEIPSGVRLQVDDARRKAGGRE